MPRVPGSARVSRRTSPSAAGRSGAVVALHEGRDRLARFLPLGLIAEEVRSGAPALQLRHRGDDRRMLVLAAPATVVGTGDEVAPNEVEWRLPATNDDPVTPAKRLEVLVVADGMILVLGHVLDEIDAPSGGTGRRQAPVVA